MDFLEIFLRVSFLVGMAGLGFVVGRAFTIDPKQISTLLVYIIVPTVIFVSVIQAPKGGGYFYYFLGAYTFSVCAALIAYMLAGFIWQDSTKNLFGYAAGTANTSFYGLPLVLALFDPTGIAIAVYIIMGLALYEFTVGYFLTARGHFTIKQSLMQVVKIPLVYAFVLAIALVEFDCLPHAVIIDSLDNFKGANTVLGMMVIGLTLAKISHFELDWKFMIGALSWRFMVCPAIAFTLIFLLGERLAPQAQAIILLFSCVPMAVSTVLVANALSVHPEKAATTVMASTLLSLFTVPFMLSLL